MSDLFTSGVRPAIDEYLAKKAAEKRDYGPYWSASSAGYCMRKLIFDRLKVPHTKEQDARKTRVFEAGHIFHEFIQGITKNAGLSVASEVELQDENLMVRGHFDDLILVSNRDAKIIEQSNTKVVVDETANLILYDYKTQNSRAFSYQKGKPMSFYHMMQLGTYMYMIRKMDTIDWQKQHVHFVKEYTKELTEARILKISKDDLRMSEEQLLWSPQLEKQVYEYWSTLNGYWKAKQIPKCTCADHEGGFLAREAYNDYWYQDEPCSLEWLKLKVKEGIVKW